MRKTVHQLIALAFLSILFTSCAIHQPMSEMVMFKEKRAHSDSTYSSKYSHSIASFSIDRFVESAVLDYVGYNSQSDRELSYGNPASFTTNMIFLDEGSNRFGASFALAPTLIGSGIDATYNLFAHYYITGAVGAGDDSNGLQYQFIFQRRLSDGNPLGLSIGAVYRRNLRVISIRTSYLGGDSKSFHSKSFGLRSVLTLAPITEYGSSRLFIHATGSYNYDMTLKTFYPKVGISIGVY